MPDSDSKNILDEAPGFTIAYRLLDDGVTATVEISPASQVTLELAQKYIPRIYPHILAESLIAARFTVCLDTENEWRVDMKHSLDENMHPELRQVLESIGACSAIQLYEGKRWVEKYDVSEIEKFLTSFTKQLGSFSLVVVVTPGIVDCDENLGPKEPTQGVASLFIENRVQLNVVGCPTNQAFADWINSILACKIYAEIKSVHEKIFRDPSEERTSS